MSERFGEANCAACSAGKSNPNCALTDADMTFISLLLNFFCKHGYIGLWSNIRKRSLVIVHTLSQPRCP
jgi:hypothetical protein